jgi:hypothetical protein
MSDEVNVPGWIGGVVPQLVEAALDIYWEGAVQWPLTALLPRPGRV